MNMNGQLVQQKAQSALAVSPSGLTLSSSQSVAVPITLIEGFDARLYYQTTQRDRIYVKERSTYSIKYRCTVSIEGLNTSFLSPIRADIVQLFIAVNGTGLSRSVSYGSAYQISTQGSQTIEFTLPNLVLNKGDYVQIGVKRLSASGTVELVPDGSSLFIERISL